jgi:two-component system NarL family response regulator
MGNPEIRNVLVAHEDAIVSMGLAAALGQHPDFHVVTADAGVDELDEAVQRHSPDIVVSDYRRAMTYSVNAAARQRTRGAQPRKIVIVTTCDREFEIRGALQTGVRGYVLLGTRLDEFVEGMRAVGQGAYFLSRSVAPRIASSLSHDSLTVRESEVLQLLAEGLGNKQIARELGISTETVKCHVKAILDKLGASTRTQAAAIASKRGLVHARIARSAVHPSSRMLMEA